MRAHLSFQTGLVDNLVNVVCSYARFGGRRSNIQDFSGEPAHLPHAFLAFLIQNLDLVPHAKYSLALGNAIQGIIGIWY